MYHLVQKFTVNITNTSPSSVKLITTFERKKTLNMLTSCKDSKNIIIFKLQTKFNYVNVLSVISP